MRLTIRVVLRSSYGILGTPDDNGDCGFISGPVLNSEESWRQAAVRLIKRDTDLDIQENQLRKREERIQKQKDRSKKTPGQPRPQRRYKAIYCDAVVSDRSVILGLRTHRRGRVTAQEVSYRDVRSKRKLQPPLAAFLEKHKLTSYVP